MKAMSVADGRCPDYALLLRRLNEIQVGTQCRLLNRLVQKKATPPTESLLWTNFPTKRDCCECPKRSFARRPELAPPEHAQELVE
jgi:hypothetical protein